MFDKLHEECGIFGIHAGDKGDDVVMSTYYALYALQHRGQESCGIAVNDSGVISMHKGLGLVPEVFSKDTLERVESGQMAIGHVRYSTTGSQNVVNAQPLMIRHVKGHMALAHNGNLTNAASLREEVEMRGGIFHTTNDSEVIAYMITCERLKTESIEKAVEKAMYRLKGAYSILVMSPSKLIAARDPVGFRPLCMGETKSGAVVFSSESCALDAQGARFIRDVEPGEIIVVDREGVKSIKTHCGGPSSLCLFEFVYLARPDSVIDGVSVYESRKNAGRILAQEHPVEADLVFGVPDSGLDAAIGYSAESGIPYGTGFVKNRYVGRTFIQPTQEERDSALKVKLNVLAESVRGKRVIMIDDSIVRGTTSMNLAKMLREAGAAEVHMRISSPPFLYPCHFGTDVDSREKLIANLLSHSEIEKKLGVDTLGYLSLEGLKETAAGCDCGFCVGCFTGEYPVEVPKDMPKDKFEQKIRQEESV